MSRWSLSSRHAPSWRMWAVAGALAAALLFLAAKAGHLQLFLGEDLERLAERQYARKLKIAAPRGNIYDRAGRPLAITVPAWSVYAAPRDVEDPAEAARKLAPILGQDRVRLEKRLRSKRAFLWLDRRVAPDVAEAVRALNMRGIGLKQEARRYYPNRELAGQLLGLVSVDGEGLDGVERAFEEHLRGRTLLVPGLRDNRGRRVVLADGVDIDVLDGDDVHLTLDARLQHVTEAVLEEAVRKHRAKGGFAVVMEPDTGAIRALANVPLFNPNSPGAASPAARRNHVLSDGFEPGSVFKIVTFAAALDAGLLKPSDRIFCENGRLVLGKHVIRDAHPAGWLTAAEVFSHSSNIGTIKIAQRLGEERFCEVIRRFGFGEKPGLGLVEETAGLLPSQKRWGDVRTATVSFGHGLLVSPLQMALAVATIANGGVRVPPRLLEKVTSPTGEVVRVAPEPVGERVIREEAARVLTEIMTGVVGQDGTGALAAIRGVRVAGKTGTAEKVDPVTKRYSRELHLSSFVGFAPADDPKIAAVVMLDEPKGVVFGGATAGPAWRAIVEAALVEAGVLTARDRAAETSATTGAPAEEQKPIREVRADTVLAEVAQEREAKGGAPVPLDLRGLTAREVLVVAERLGLHLELEGTGIVVAQEPGPKTPIAPGTTVRVTLGEET